MVQYIRSKHNTVVQDEQKATHPPPAVAVPAVYVRVPNAEYKGATILLQYA